MEEKGKPIKFFSNTEKDDIFNQKLPDIEKNSCANCSEALWRHNSKKGPTCFCTATNEYTYIWENDTLSEQILDCARSRLHKTEEELKEANDTAE